MATPTQSDEIDLGALHDLVNKFFKGILVSIFKAINFCLRNWIIITILVVVGGALGFFTQDDSTLPKSADVVIKTNYDTAPYAYNALELLFNKSKEKDKAFLEKNGFRTDTIEIKKIEIDPIISFSDIATKYEPNDRNLDAILRNVDFEEEIDKVNTFNSDYRYHKIEFSLSSIAGDETIEKVMNYLNNEKLIKEISNIGRQNIIDDIARNEKTFSQINTILDNYTEGQSLPSPSSQIFVVDKNFNISNMLELKMELQKEHTLLKEKLVFAEKAIVRLSDQVVYTPTGGILENKMIMYPVLLVFIFLFFAWIRHSYLYVKRIAKS